MSQRADGSYFVIDGNHRALAAVRRTDVDKVPAWVLTGLTREEEASTFVAMNAHRKPLTGVELFAADLCAKNDDAVMVDRMVRAHGAKILSDSKDPNACRCPRLLLEIIEKHGSAALDQVLGFIADTWPGNPNRMKQAVIGGSRAFIAKYGASNGNGNSLAEPVQFFKRVDPAVLMTRMTAFQQLHGLSRPQCFDMAMVEAWNKAHPRKKIVPKGQ